MFKLLIKSEKAEKSRFFAESRLSVELWRSRQSRGGHRVHVFRNRLKENMPLTKTILYAKNSSSMETPDKYVSPKEVEMIQKIETPAKTKHKRLEIEQVVDDTTPENCH